MKTRKELESDVSKLTEASGNIQTELDQLSLKEKNYLKQASEDILAGIEGQSIQELSDIRSRKEALNHALTLAGTRLEGPETDLRNLGYTEAAQRWEKADGELRKELEHIQIVIAEVNAELGDFQEHIKQARPLVQGEGVAWLPRYHGVWVECSRDLYTAWSLLEQVMVTFPNRPLRPASKGPGDFPGFGKRA